MLTQEQVAEELATPPEYEEIQNLDQNYAVFRKTIRELLEVEEQGQADSDSVDATIGQAIEDHAENQLEIFGLEIEVDVDPGVDAPFAAQLGSAIAEIINSNYEDADEGIAELSQVAGMSPEEVVSCISGQAIPTVQSCEVIANEYLADDEEAYQTFLLIAQDAHAESGYEEEPETSEMSAEVEQLRAEFSVMQEQQEVGQRLRHLEKLGTNLLNENILTPAEHATLFGSDAFREDPDSVSVFCEFCAANNTSPHNYLDNVEFCLNWKSQCGPSNYGAFFSEMVQESLEVPETEVRQQQTFVSDYRSRHGYQ
ncbi:hypothetical protein BZZ01_04945 [Nostocales cyanobacterium HT-58-2]|nr:hypothetical protein BZZ01_04945 [Nostocales cyanobacterium HT-58-2]